MRCVCLCLPSFVCFIISHLHQETLDDIKWVRIAVDGGGFIGVINVITETTLDAARALIAQEVDDAPENYKFIVRDAPVSEAQEQTYQAYRVSGHGQRLTLRPCRAPSGGAGTCSCFSFSLLTILWPCR